jgi:hypothetical protein
MQPSIRFRRYSNETVSRAIVLLSPYLFWAMISATCASLWLFLG